MVSRKVKISSTCEDCGEEFTAILFGRALLKKYCDPCADLRHRAFQEDIERRRRASIAYMQDQFRANAKWGIPERYRGQIWGDFKFDRGGEANKKAVRFLRDYSGNFPVEGMPVGRQSVILASRMNGVGKTMLACLVMDTIIGRYEQTGRERSPVQLWSAGDIRMRLRSAERFGSQETQEAVYLDYGSMPLLIIDDVGKEQLEGREAGFNYDMYFQIIDQRYKRRLPLMLTSNLGPVPEYDGGPSLVDLMGRASVSRLVEMTEGAFFEIEGEDRR